MGIRMELIVAGTRRGGIGVRGGLPWQLPGEMKYFKEITMKTKDEEKMNCCIMGRKTYLSIPKKFRPLSKRINIVLTRTPENRKLIESEGAIAVDNLSSALEVIQSKYKDKIERTFVIGGIEAFKEAMESSQCKSIYYTLVLREFECDTFFPPIDSNKFQLETQEKDVPVHEENGIKYQFLKYNRV